MSVTAAPEQTTVGALFALLEEYEALREAVGAPEADAAEQARVVLRRRSKPYLTCPGCLGPNHDPVRAPQCAGIYLYCRLCLLNLGRKTSPTFDAWFDAMEEGLLAESDLVFRWAQNLGLPVVAVSLDATGLAAARGEEGPVLRVWLRDGPVAKPPHWLRALRKRLGVNITLTDAGPGMAELPLGPSLRLENGA